MFRVLVSTLLFFALLQVSCKSVIIVEERKWMPSPAHACVQKVNSVKSRCAGTNNEVIDLICPKLVEQRQSVNPLYYGRYHLVLEVNVIEYQ